MAYAPKSRSSTLTSRDRLIVAHPSPTETTISPYSHTHSASNQPSLRAPLSRMTDLSPRPRRNTWMSPPAQSNRYRQYQCTLCHRHLWAHEFPRTLPTARCVHANTVCVYCLHEGVRRMWGRDVMCPVCGESAEEKEARRMVLMWVVEGG
jgi:uncharacterized CHY-type Zn-finger protein